MNNSSEFHDENLNCPTNINSTEHQASDFPETSNQSLDLSDISDISDVDLNDSLNQVNLDNIEDVSDIEDDEKRQIREDERIAQNLQREYDQENDILTNMSNRLQDFGRTGNRLQEGNVTNTFLNSLKKTIILLKQ